MPLDPEAVLEQTLRRANRVYVGGRGLLRGTLKEAEQLLAERLTRSSRLFNQQPGSTFSEAQAVVYRRQVKLTQEYVDKRLAGLTHAQAEKAMKQSIRDAARVIKAYEIRYSGIAKALSLEDAMVMDDVVRGTSASLLRQHQSSVNRYGRNMIGEFERVMRAGMVTAMPQHEVISRMVSVGATQGIDAELLHSLTPGSFPEPTGYMRRRYWAERIVRTETAHAYNTMNLQSIQTVRSNDFPDMKKKILATFDMRTAMDSVGVHGQVRKPEENFRDGAGREYLRPPARPNDRETVVPWREHWKETPRTREATEAEVQAAEVAEDPGVAVKKALAAAARAQLARKAKAVAAQRAKASVKAKAKAKAKLAAKKAAELEAKVPRTPDLVDGQKATTEAIVKPQAEIGLGGG